MTSTPSSSLPVTIESSVSDSIRPGPISAATSWTDTGASNWRWLPSGSVITGMDLYSGARGEPRGIGKTHYFSKLAAQVAQTNQPIGTTLAAAYQKVRSVPACNT